MKRLFTLLALLIVGGTIASIPEARLTIAVVAASPFRACTGSSPSWSSSADQTSIQSCLDQMSDGDTLTIAAGSFTATSTITGPNDVCVHILGDGIGSTVITDGAGSANPALRVYAPDTCGAGGYVEVAGITFDDNFVANSTTGNLEIVYNTDKTNMLRIHDNDFDDGQGRQIYVDATSGHIASGVIDHNRFELGYGGGTSGQAIWGRNCTDGWPNALHDVYDTSPLDTIGTASALYLEDNSFEYATEQDGSLDAYSCGRTVTRFNELHGANFGSHGTDGSRRGTTVEEFYFNTMDTDTYTPPGRDQTGRVRQLRSGFSLFFYNTADTSVIGNNQIYQYRTNPNFTNAQGWSYGSCTENLGGPNATVDNDTSPDPEGNTRPVGYPCLDQTGWWVDSSYNYTRLPAYNWGNARGGSLLPITVNGAHTGITDSNGSGLTYYLEDVDFFNEDASFDGTSGVGIGTRAEMDAITPTLDLVAFWVTDEGEWNSTNGTGMGDEDGRLYQWDGMAWVLIYTPYTYPHPLVTGGGGDVTSPSVSITSPMNLATVSGASVAIDADCTDDTSVAGVQFRVDGSNVGAEDTSAPYSVTWDTTMVTDGGHSISAVCRDSSNNTDTDAITVVFSSNGGGTNPIPGRALIR